MRDMVFLQLSLSMYSNRNLSPRFYGPYKVIKMIGQVAHELELAEDLKFILFFMLMQEDGRLQLALVFISTRE